MGFLMLTAIMMNILNTIFVFDKHPESQLLHSIYQSFNGADVYISERESHPLRLISVSSDVMPLTWYLYNHKTQKLTDVARSANAPKQPNPTYSFKYLADDKTQIQGFVTLPNVAQQQNLPAVLLVHGGPFGVSDKWTYDAEAQYLSQLGYAIIRINYRGSGGRGYQFEIKGFEQWGNKIQTDLFDGIDYLAKEKNH